MRGWMVVDVPWAYFGLDVENMYELAYDCRSEEGFDGRFMMRRYFDLFASKQ